ncbi:aminopeptidase N [Zafaria cholistanensis]|uniref:Aminopeptidase N n=1 Tax=Zafaria cholistanensis TaxID=1682741 RepID=A0A5A7NN91_9MICC|nr:aminopeptidase N [Zafaria cholistanensis]GER22059.1 aminopeptidase N [Zafaria cholistanensis]
MDDAENPPAGNIARAEAAERARILAVDSYQVHLDLSGARDPERAGYPSRTRVTFSCSEPGAGTFLDFIHGGVSAVTLNGHRLDPGSCVVGDRILLPGLAARNTAIVEGTALYSTSGEGLHRYTDPADGETYLYTQFEPADARRVFANFEQPDLKAEFDFTVTAPAGWHVASNGAARGREENPDGTTTHFFEPTRRIPTYITAVLAGPYHRATDSWRREGPDGTVLEVALGAACRASLAPHFDAGAIFETTKRGLDFFHDLFGYPYPWGKYDQAFVPEYNLGAMENPGLVTFTESYVFTSRATEAQYEARDTTLLHEMAHMWFGDLVTMRWWDDLWLKESFADYMGTLAAAEAAGRPAAWVTFASRRKAWAYVQDQLPTTHPIVADIPDLEAARQNFDGITYAKGASVLKQLAAYVGRDAFTAAARGYFRRHAYGNTTLRDFLDALEDASGRDMGAWADAWLRTAGVPVLGVELGDDGGGRPGAVLTSATLRQEGRDPQAGTRVLRPHLLRLGLFELRGGALERTGSLDVEATGAATELGALAGRPRPALVLPNDGDLTYAKVRLDPVSAETLLGHLDTLDEPLARATAWASLWNMVRDAILPAPRFLGAVRRMAASAREVSVLQQLLEQAATAVEAYCSPALRSGEHQLLVEAVHGHLAAAEPGSDHQLAFARSLAALARAGGADETVVDLLAGNAAIPGLVVDEQLRWALLQAAAARALVDVDRLDEELAAVPSAVAMVGHAVAVAARPSLQAKREAWDAALSGAGPDGRALSNDLLSAAVRGFGIGSHELLDGFTAGYWPELSGIWSRMSIGQATRVVEGLFPRRQDLGPEGPEAHPVLAAADAWLRENAEAPPALRRIVLEQRDHLSRSLRAQAASETQD